MSRHGKTLNLAGSLLTQDSERIYFTADSPAATGIRAVPSQDSSGKIKFLGGGGKMSLWKFAQRSWLSLNWMSGGAAARLSLNLISGGAAARFSFN